MPIVRIETPEGVVIRRSIAGVGKRVAAAALDLAIFFILAVIALIVLGVFSLVDPTGSTSLLIGVLFGGVFLLLVGYLSIAPIAGRGRTLGKRWLKLRVVSADGFPATPTQHLLRSALWLVEFLVPPGGLLGIVSMTLSAQRQRLGDRVAGTIVLDEREEPLDREPFGGVAWSSWSGRTLALSPALAARFDAQEFELLRDFVVRRAAAMQVPEQLVAQMAERFAMKLGVVQTGEPQALLVELYLFLREMRRS